MMDKAPYGWSIHEDPMILQSFESKYQEGNRSIVISETYIINGEVVIVDTVIEKKNEEGK